MLNFVPFYKSQEQMFQLNFDVSSNQNKINRRDKILMMGSCFSENIGSILSDYKFDVTLNPFGTIYNPYSIIHLLKHAIEGSLPAKPIQNGEIFYDWNAHSKISGLTQSELDEKRSEALYELKTRITEAKWAIITPGTAWVYHHITEDTIVANCHKIPQKEFEKRLLNPEQIVSQFKEVKHQVKKINPALKWIFTISPVRHIKDGLVENNQSKSVLHLATMEIVRDEENCYYFPSYEIAIDQLRDYRFYTKDLIHPNEVAIEFIWTQFIKSTMDEETKRFIEEWHTIRQAIQHKPLHPGAANHQNFINKTISKLKGFKDLDTTKEIQQLQKQLKA